MRDDTIGVAYECSQSEICSTVSPINPTTRIAQSKDLQERRPLGPDCKQADKFIYCKSQTDETLSLLNHPKSKINNAVGSLPGDTDRRY